MKQEWFESWFDSVYYPILYKNRNEEEAQAFVDTLMDYLNIPATAIVADIACGEGRFSKQLSKYAAQVIGFDLSNERILKAKEKFENDRISFFVHDMRQPMHVNFFDYAFNFFTSFGYFNSYNDHLQAAKSLSNAIKPGAYLIIDYFNSTFVKANLVSAETKAIDGIHFEIKKYADAGKIVKEIKVRDGDIEKHYFERVSDVSKDDFEQLFAKAGLVLERTFGNYQLLPFDIHTSPRLIMIFKKK